jgi:hypothetical protein
MLAKQTRTWAIARVRAKSQLRLKNSLILELFSLLFAQGIPQKVTAAQALLSSKSAVKPRKS